MDSQTPHSHPHDQLLPALEKAASRASSSPPQRTDEAQAQASAPIPRRPKVGPPGEGGRGYSLGPSADASWEEGPKGGHSHPASSRPHPLPREPSQEEAGFQGTPGGGFGGCRAQGSGSRILGSDVTQDPGSLCGGSREWARWGLGDLEHPRRPSTAPSKEGHLDSPSL